MLLSSSLACLIPAKTLPPAYVERLTDALCQVAKSDAGHPAQLGTGVFLRADRVREQVERAALDAAAEAVQVTADAYTDLMAERTDQWIALYLSNGALALLLHECHDGMVGRCFIAKGALVQPTYLCPLCGAAKVMP